MCRAVFVDRAASYPVLSAATKGADRLTVPCGSKDGIRGGHQVQKRP